MDLSRLSINTLADLHKLISQQNQFMSEMYDAKERLASKIRKLEQRLAELEGDSDEDYE